MSKGSFALYRTSSCLSVTLLEIQYLPCSDADLPSQTLGNDPCDHFPSLFEASAPNYFVV